MLRKFSMLIAFAVLCALALQAQQPTDLPTKGGVYYRTPAGWVELSSSMLFPYLKGAWKNMLSVGYRHYEMSVPASRALLQITDRRPTFYVRGLRPEQMRQLVRVAPKGGHREIRVPARGAFSPPSRFSPGDLRAVERSLVADDVVAIRPKSDLDPGEYMLVSGASPGQEWILMAHDFGVGGK